MKINDKDFADHSPSELNTENYCDEWFIVEVSQKADGASIFLSRQNAILLRDDLDEFIKRCDP
jgi:hypothetical protein